jgi:hypothetical protein
MSLLFLQLPMHRQGVPVNPAPPVLLAAVSGHHALVGSHHCSIAWSGCLCPPSSCSSRPIVFSSAAGRASVCARQLCECRPCPRAAAATHRHQTRCRRKTLPHHHLCCRRDRDASASASSRSFPCGIVWADALADLISTAAQGTLPRISNSLEWPVRRWLRVPRHSPSRLHASPCLSRTVQQAWPGRYHSHQIWGRTRAQMVLRMLPADFLLHTHRAAWRPPGASIARRALLPPLPMMSLILIRWA